MLFLLRNIRRKLISTDNKIITYLLYAIGEIFLVVVGILIAVQIDGWKEENQKSAQANIYLERLYNEYLMNLKTFSEHIDVLNHRNEVTARFCASLNDPSTSDQQLVKMAGGYISEAVMYPVYNPSVATFEDLSSTGNLSLIKDIELREAIVQHQAHYERAIFSFEANIQWITPIDAPFSLRNELLRFDPMTVHLYPPADTSELAEMIRTHASEYRTNATNHYWINEDGAMWLKKSIGATAKMAIRLYGELNGAISPVKVSSKLPDPLAAGWKGEKVCEVLYEDLEIRVLKCNFIPGYGHEKHYHPTHLGIALKGGTFQITDTSGTRQVDIPDGYVFVNKMINIHEVQNVGSAISQYLIMEPKNQ